MGLRLIIEDDEGTTTIVPLASEAITIGRQQGNTIQLTEKNVSRRHARLFLDDSNWVIEDLGSYNGLKVNGQFVENSFTLSEGDVVQIGDYHLALTDDVEKRTLDFDGREVGAATAANDGAEAMVASSSAELPKLSQDDLSMPSGPHAPAALIESGPVSASSENERSRAGLWIGLSAAALALIGGVAYLAVSTANRSATTRAAAAGPAIPVEAKSSDATPTPTNEPEPTPTDEPPEGNEEPAAGTGDEAAPAADDAEVGDETPSPDDETKTPADETAETAPTPETEETPKKRGKKKRKPGAATAGPDADQLLKEARMLQFQNPDKAYTLARQAYRAKHTQGALVVMASAACRLKRVGDAKRAIRSLRGKAKEQMISACNKQGVQI